MNVFARLFTKPEYDFHSIRREAADFFDGAASAYMKTAIAAARIEGRDDAFSADVSTILREIRQLARWKNQLTTSIITAAFVPGVRFCASRHSKTTCHLFFIFMPLSSARQVLQPLHLRHRQSSREKRYTKPWFETCCRGKQVARLPGVSRSRLASCVAVFSMLTTTTETGLTVQTR